MGGDSARSAAASQAIISPHPPPRGGDSPGRAGHAHELIKPPPPRLGGDPGGRTPPRCQPHFNPRPPHGGRPGIFSTIPAGKTFQSTPPAWGATQGFDAVLLTHGISIHAPRMGGDQSPPPPIRILSISIHAPRMGGDSKNSQIMRPFLQKTYDFHKHHPAVIPDSESAVYARENYLKNLVRSYRAFLFTWTSHLKHQDILWTIRSLCSKMLNFVLITIPQVIKSKAVLLGIHNLA